ncbi:SAM binding motif containing protein [Talaromyces stipitatus ATCC 10500]|uniref:SAM binding motif containing protein n=1 Tax=Talaromyces stipitatus (strain ATCC 10500 / CBS 375.48 / QM 6759 / NRRL 1006) TaxID=441959 RepID=B8LXL1_TALSN|nr:SAM binding motif containing protein [Talaromyces stipitatus ATCC 10500]EED24512.1 SAM binding motif containing protein [Talaromyces stipitatus ATCC 10500]
MNGPSFAGASTQRHASVSSSSTNPQHRGSATNTNSSSLSSSSQHLNNGPDADASTSSLSSSATPPDYIAKPFTRINDRTYFRDPENPYPLPCDLPEIHRQSLRTLTLIRVFGAPFCAPQLKDKRPKKVLELACGSGLWSHACHDYFLEHDAGAAKSPKDSKKTTTSFTGLDIVPIAPDLRRKGINWHFVRHDIRKPSLPFPSEHFDFVFIKDAGLCQSATAQQMDLLGEPLRVLKRGGILEVWDSDHVFRALLPNPTPPPNLSKKDQNHADATATYTISSATPFAAAQNKYLLDYNSWIEKAFEKRKLTPMPCATIGLSFTTEADAFHNVGSRRVAIPLGAEVRWEQTSGRGKLNAEQLALRHTALTTTIQMIEGMELMLMEASGKSRDEWDRWWAAMTTDFLQKNGLANGECLEVGAWWGQKR